jgi:hypothetical protein
MRVLSLSLSLLAVFAQATFAAEQQHPLVGNWKLISYKLIVGNDEPRDFLGQQPKGYLILTPEGRMMALLTSDTRKFGPSDAERAELEKSMIAYSGKYRIEGGDFITTVDTSWNEAWNGTEQRRHYSVEGDKLMIEAAPQPSTVFLGKTSYGKLVWERDR